MTVQWEVLRVHDYIKDALVNECKPLILKHLQLPEHFNLTMTELMHVLIEEATEKKFENGKLN